MSPPVAKYHAVEEVRARLGDREELPELAADQLGGFGAFGEDLDDVDVSERAGHTKEVFSPGSWRCGKKRGP